MTKADVLIIFLVIGIVLWPITIGLRSFVSGWHFLSKKYEYKGKIPNSAQAFLKKKRLLINIKKEERQFYFLCMGYVALFMPYYDVLKMKSDSNAIYFCKDVFLLRFLHPPLKIPFSEISGKERLLFSRPIVELTTKADPRQRIWISVKLAEWFEGQSGNRWAFSRR